MGLSKFPLDSITQNQFSEGLALVKLNSHFGFINKQGSLWCPQFTTRLMLLVKAYEGLASVEPPNSFPFSVEPEREKPTVNMSH